MYYIDTYKYNYILYGVGLFLLATFWLTKTLSYLGLPFKGHRNSESSKKLLHNINSKYGVD